MQEAGDASLYDIWCPGKMSSLGGPTLKKKESKKAYKHFITRKRQKERDREKVTDRKKERDKRKRGSKSDRHFITRKF